MDIIMLMAAFIMLAGVAVLYCGLFHLNPAEGMIPAVLTVILVSGVSGDLFGKVFYGIIICLIAAAAGYVSQIYKLKSGNVKLSDIISIYWAALLALLCFSMFIYHGARILVTEDLYHWALIPKYILKTGKMVPWFVEERGSGSGIFYAFFLSFAGLNEGLLYSSAALLYWIGLLLPFGNIKREGLFRLILYIFTVYFSIYALFYFGTKTLCAALPCACFAGGLYAWIISVEMKLKKLPVLLSGLILLIIFDPLIGILLGILLILLALLQYAIDRKKEDIYEDIIADIHYEDYKDNLGVKWFSNKIISGIFVAAFFLTLVIGSIYCYNFTIHFKESAKNAAGALNLIKSRTYMFPGAFLSGVFGQSLSYEYPQLHFTFISCLLLSVVLMGLSGYIKKKIDKSILLIGCSSVFAVIYLVVNYHRLLVVNGYGGILSKSTLPMVFSSFSVFVFVSAFAWLLIPGEIRLTKIPEFTGLALLLVFMYCSVNKTYLPYTTAFAPVLTEGYQDIYYTDIQIEELQKDIRSDSKILFIDQQGDEMVNYPANEARYQLLQHVSDYKYVPWKFTVGGGYIGNQIDSGLTLLDLKSYLSSGNYRYVWIYRTDDYLNKTLPKIFGNDSFESQTGETGKKTDKTKEVSDLEKQKQTKNTDNIITQDTIRNGQLYKVVYKKNGNIDRLEFVRNLITYDNRDIYYYLNNIIN